MDKLKCLEAFMRIIELTQQIAGLAWKRMAPSAIMNYAQEIIIQAEDIIKEVENEEHPAGSE